MRCLFIVVVDVTGLLTDIGFPIPTTVQPVVVTTTQPVATTSTTIPTTSTTDSTTITTVELTTGTTAAPGNITGNYSIYLWQRILFASFAPLNPCSYHGS